MSELLFDEADQHFMSLALLEAQAALAGGDFPVGAVLAVNGELWGKDRNSLFTDVQATSHAEHKLFYAHSQRLRQRRLEKGAGVVCLYTTLEPCLMCLGIAVMHRVDRIIVGCPDPTGGTTNLDPASLGSVYTNWWPKIQVGLYREESCRLVIESLKTGKFMRWESLLSEFTALQHSWSET